MLSTSPSRSPRLVQLRMKMAPSGAVATIGAIVGGWHALGLPSYSLGYVDLAIFAAMMPTIMIVAPVGVRVGHMLSETWLRRIFTVLLFVIAADLIRKLVV